MKDDFTDLTLIIFVRDRQFNISKVIEYYSSFNCKKIIYDSSEKPISGWKEISKFFKSKNFQYVWLDAVPYLVAKNLAFSDVKTEYVIDCPDDDLFIIPSIKKGVKFLRDNPDYVSCQGHENWYNSKAKVIGGCKSNNYYDYHLSNDFAISDPVHRLQVEIPYFIGYAHALHRTKFHSQNNRFLLENPEYRSGVWEEIIPGILSAIHGNRKVIPDIWVYRHSTDSNLGRISLGNKARDTYFYGTDKYIINKENLKPVSKYLSDVAEIDEDESFKIIKSILEERESNSKIEAYGWSPTNGIDHDRIIDLMDGTADFY